MAKSNKRDPSHAKGTPNAPISTPVRTTRVPSTDPRELALVELLHQRDPQSLTYLVDYAGRLEARLCRKFGVYIPTEDIKDLVADALVEACQKGPTYNPFLSSVSTWLSMHANYNALAYLRKNEVFVSQTLDELAERIGNRIEEDAPRSAETPSVRIEALLAKLSPQRAEAVRLYHYDRLSFEHIARRMGIATVSVRSLLSRAHDDLRELLVGNESPCDDV